MSEHKPVIFNQETDAVITGWLSGELHIEENPDIALKVIDRMWVELQGFHRLVWLWPGCDSAQPCNGKTAAPSYQLVLGNTE